MSFIKRNIPIVTDALTPTTCLLGGEGGVLPHPDDFWAYCFFEVKNWIV